MSDEATKVVAVENGNNAMSLAALMTALNNVRNNPAEMMALLNNNGVGGNNAMWILFMFMLWGQNGNGGWFGNNNGGALQAMNVDDQLNAIRTQINNNSNTDLLNQAIQGNTAA